MSLERSILSKYCLKLFPRWSQKDTKVLDIVAIIQICSNLFKPKSTRRRFSLALVNEKLKTYVPVAPLKTSPNVSTCIQLFNLSWGRVEQLSFTTHFFAKSGRGNGSQSLDGETSNRQSPQTR